MSLYEMDTIAAISTPYGKGGVAVIRISGEEAVRIAHAVFQPMKNKEDTAFENRKAYYGIVCDPEKQKLDDVVLTFFQGPHSYTGEDTIEICCHGGIVVTQAVLETVLAAGARQALPGEYTKRAFVNGKMKLSSAEALGNLLEATNKAQVKLFRSGMDGILSKKIEDTYEKLGDVLSRIFVCIDYPDEDISSMSREEMKGILESVCKDLGALERTYQTGHAVAEGIPTVICGQTNVGKSSVYNMLLQKDAAIVTDIAGTTRDVLSENITLGKVLLRISDTAGLRETEDAVEKIGVDRARKKIDEAELVLAVFDASKPLDAEDREIIDYLASASKKTLILLNKADKPVCVEEEELKSRFSDVFYVSAKNAQGREQMEEAVNRFFIDGSLNLSNDAIVSNARQFAAVLKAKNGVERAMQSLTDQVPLDLCCADMEFAMQMLGEVDGREVSEDVVDKIFSHFCVGK